MTTEAINKSAWSWKFFSTDFLLEKKSEQKKSSIAISLFIAFTIVFVSAQFLGFANTVYNKKILMKKYQNLNVVVYSNIA